MRSSPTSPAHRPARRPSAAAPSPRHVHPAVLGPAGFVLARRVHLTSRHRLESRRDAHASQPILDRLRSLVAERQVVLLGAAVVGAPGQGHRLAAALLDARGVLVDGAGRFRRQHELVEVEVDRLQRARPDPAAAFPALAGALAAAGVALAALAAVRVGRARLALPGDARLPGRALAVVAARARLRRWRLAAAGVALLPTAAVAVAAALLALAVHAVFLLVAVLVLAALGILG